MKEFFELLLGIIGASFVAVLLVWGSRSIYKKYFTPYKEQLWWQFFLLFYYSVAGAFIISSFLYLSKVEADNSMLWLGEFGAHFVGFFLRLFCIAIILGRLDAKVSKRFKNDFIKQQVLLFVSTIFAPFLGLFLSNVLLHQLFDESLFWDGSAFNFSSLELYVLFFVVMPYAIVRFFYNVKLYEERKNDELAREELKRLQIENQQQLLQSKINPHFLYNSLNTIAAMAHEDADKTEQLALNLSGLFRTSLSMQGRSLIPLSEELRYVKQYLEIEKIRFEDRLDFEIDCPKELLDFQLPAFMVHILVENAIKHGISHISSNGKMKILFKMEGNQFVFSVADNGPDFPEHLNVGEGLRILTETMDVIYQDQWSWDYTNTAEKMIVVRINQNL